MFRIIAIPDTKFYAIPVIIILQPQLSHTCSRLLWYYRTYCDTAVQYVPMHDHSTIRRYVRAHVFLLNRTIILNTHVD
jgi:hypothetical protein